MRLPRDLTGAQFVRDLGKMDCKAIRQTGSHVRLTCESPAQHHVTVPLHDPLRVGTLAAILSAVSEAHGLTREQLQTKILV